MMTENEISKHVVDAALKIHKLFGLGLLESVYEVVLAAELERRGLRVKRQQPSLSFTKMSDSKLASGQT